ncbi:MAG: hypothetical protein H6635_02655 [Anaerolineales bacterium]|nr:hypothetical protein [Anaerolineales bacterium]
MRKHNFINVVLLVIFVVAGCGSVPTESTLPENEAQATTVNESTPIAVQTNVSTEAVAASVEACKLPAFAFTNVGFGLPNPSHKLPSLGDVKTIVLFADFSDVPASQTPEEVFSIISPDAEKFFNINSYGRMNWELTPHFVWLRLSQPSSVYGDAIRSYEGHLQFLQEAVNLADANIDFSSADSVVVIVPPQAANVGYGPAFGANPGEGYSADGRTFANGVTSGADLPVWGFLWLNHESGHTMGLPDLYAYQFDYANYDDQHRFVGGFGLMGYIDGLAPEFFAFERWQLGWLDDVQIVCQQDGEQTITLTSIETEGGVKAVMIPVNESKVVVVESRRPVGYDAGLSKSGALVYTVDTSIASGEGTLVVYPILEGDPYRNQSPLAVGETVTVDGVTVTVIDASDGGDTVSVTITK